MKRSSRSRCGTTLGQFFVRVEEPASIDARPAIQSPSFRQRPRKGALACASCTLLIAPGERPPDCAIWRCPRTWIPAPTKRAAWENFVEAASKSPLP
jgi:hypothetical protein